MKARLEQHEILTAFHGSLVILHGRALLKTWQNFMESLAVLHERLAVLHESLTTLHESPAGTASKFQTVLHDGFSLHKSCWLGVADPVYPKCVCNAVCMSAS
jgi:hypothetical protein